MNLQTKLKSKRKESSTFQNIDGLQDCPQVHDVRTPGLKRELSNISIISNHRAIELVKFEEAF